MTDTNEKIRALFLSALMVMSVFGMTVAFAGTAAASNHADQNFDSVSDLEGSLVYSGQEVSVDVSGLSGGPSDDEDVQLRRITGDDTSQAVATITVDNQQVTFDTSDRQTGNYFLQGDGLNEGNSTFEIVEQDLSASFSDSQVTNDGATVDLTIESDLRNTYNVTVTVDGFSQSDYEQVFGPGNVNADGDAAVLEDAEGTHNLNFDGISEGDYTFDVDVDDTTASASADITVSAPDEEQANFVNDPYTGTVGDNVTIDLETQAIDGMNVSLGGDGYESTLVLQDVDDEVSITLNTFNAGKDDVNSTYEVDGATIASGSEETSISEGFRLAPEDYDLSVTPAGQEDETDFAGLTLVERSTGDAATWIAPDGTTDIGADNLDAWTEREEVAENDSVAVQVDVDGVFAYIDENVSVNGTDFTVELQNPGRYQSATSFNASDSGVSTIQDEENGTIYFVIDMDDADQSFSAGQQWEATFSIDGSENPYVADGETETASSSFTVTERALSLDMVESPYQMTPTEDSVANGQSTMAPGTEVDVRFRKGGADGFVVTVSDEIDEAGNWSVTHDFSDREVDEEFTIRVRVPGDANNPYVDNADAIFSDTAEADTVADVEALNERITELEEENQELQDQVATLESERDQLQEDLSSVEQERDELQDEVDELREQEPDEVTRTVTVTVTPEDSDADTDGQPGFGIAIAVVALLAAALLAVRRNA